MNPADMPESFRVAIPIVAGVGNALLAVPMVRMLKRHHPAARISILARLDAMAEPFRRLNEVEEVFVMNRGWRGTLRGLRWLRRCHPDVFLVPFPSNRWQYNLLAQVSGARRVLMHSYPTGRFSALSLLPAERLPAQRGIHDVTQNLRLLRLLGIQAEQDLPPQFVLNDNDRTRAADLLHNAGIRDGTSFIAVHPGSGSTVLARAKRWPAEKYAQLIRLMRHELPQQQIVLLEGPDETGVADEIVAKIASASPLVDGVHILKLAGPLGDAAAVLERACLYVGSDSGLAHLSAAVGTAAVTLFAPADPDRVCPFGYRHLVVQPPRQCSPCMLYPWQATRPKIRCRNPMCITFIEPAAVMQAVRKALCP